MFNELIKELAEKITAIEHERKNKRTPSAQANFEHAIGVFLRNIKNASTPNSKHETFVQLRSGFYSEKRDNKSSGQPKLTSRQVRAVFEGLLALKLIKLKTRGGYSRERRGGRSTRYEPTKALLKRIVD